MCVIYETVFNFVVGVTAELVEFAVFALSRLENGWWPWSVNGVCCFGVIFFLNMPVFMVPTDWTISNRHFVLGP